MAKETFGSHLTIDGSLGDFEKLNNKEYIRKFLEDLPDIIGMKKIYGPVVVEVGPQNERDSGGFSGFVMIAESHISIHTFPKKRFATLDCYTCQGSLKKKYIVERIMEMFGFEEVEVHYLKRGKNFPVEDLIT